MIYLSNVTWIHDLAKKWTSKVKRQYDDWWQYDDSMGKERVNTILDTTRKFCQPNYFYKWTYVKQYNIHIFFLKCFIWYFPSWFSLLYHMIQCNIKSELKLVLWLEQSYNIICKPIFLKFGIENTSALSILQNIQFRRIRYWFSYYKNLCTKWRNFKRTFFRLIK